MKCFFQVDKIPIGMENVLPGFNLPMKLIGQGGSNLNYIKNETGAIVTLRGIGSAFLEPGTQQEAPEQLHFCIRFVLKHFFSFPGKFGSI